MSCSTTFTSGSSSPALARAASTGAALASLIVIDITPAPKAVADSAPPPPSARRIAPDRLPRKNRNKVKASTSREKAGWDPGPPRPSPAISKTTYRMPAAAPSRLGEPIGHDASFRRELWEHWSLGAPSALERRLLCAAAPGEW